MTKKPGIYGPDDPEAQAILKVLRGAYEKQAEEFGRAEPRADDGSLAVVAWNAVVLGHPNRFESMRETGEFAHRVAELMRLNGHIRPEASPYAGAMLAGLLSYLWSTQNVMYLDPEFARGQAGAVSELIKDINQNWSPPDGKPWFAAIRSFPSHVKTGLNKVQKQTYENVYKVLKPIISEFGETAIRSLVAVGKAHPQALPGATAYVCGVLIEQNVYSPLDGSVPEDMDKALTEAFLSVERDNEARYYPYLMRGFESVRNRQFDELDRWRIEDR